MYDLLDNIFWHTLTGPQARHAEGHGGVRRYARGFSPIAAFEDQAHPDFALLAAYCDPGETIYIDGVSTPLPAGWRIDVETTMRKMVFEGTRVDDDPGFHPVPLQREHAARAMALAELTRPGPFGPRTIELGDYFGVFEGDELVAMAGERTQAGHLREISGVCTHRDFQGHGFARRLIGLLLNRHAARGETSFLHVMSGNTSARALYARLGFRDYREVVVRAVARTASA